MSGSVEEDDILGSFMAEISKIPDSIPNNETVEDVVATKDTDLVVAKPAVAVAVAAASKPVYKSEDNVESDAVVPIVNLAADSVFNVHSNPPPPSTAYPGTNGSVLSNTNSMHSNENKNSNPFAFHTSTSSTVVIKKREDQTFKRKAADIVWEDATLSEWPENDFRLFVGDLAKETNQSMLSDAFKHYKSFAMCRVVRSKVDIKAKGYGFVSFLDPMDCAKALREMNGKYLGARPMKISKSNWADRDLGVVKHKEQKKRKMEKSLGLR